ncbi:MAG: sugar ABC transporter substrate-binding protein, partial [Butyricicoccus sp.]|nr:sugar ABC transporter substrate-binding protein [Butyricicoccus sp.]
AGVALVKSINKAGIPVMSANTNVAESGKEYLECYVGPSNILEGKQTAEQMVADIGSDAKILYIDGPTGYSTSAERRQGMDEGIAGTNIEVVESQTGEGNREKSQQVMENYLVKYPEGSIDAVFCMDDNTAIGAINAMEAAGRTDIKVYAAACGDYNTLTYIKEGKLRATAMQSPIIDAKTTLDYAVRIAKGEKMEEFENFMETPVATADNIDSLNIDPW